MNIQEFKTRTGLSVEANEYAKIEQIYLNAETMHKDDFCKAWKSAKGATLELIEELSNNVDGKRIHINRLDIKIENLNHDLEMEREIKELRARELNEACTKINKLKDMLTEVRSQQVQLALALIACGHENNAAEIIGRAGVIGLKAANNIALNEADLQFIVETFHK